VLVPAASLARRRGTLQLLTLCAVAGLLAACSAPSTTKHGPGHSGNDNHSAGQAAQLSITPANGSKNVQPGVGITVTAAHGKITNVSVHAAGDPVSGTMNPAHTSWHSDWTLGVSTSYTVTATATGSSGKQVTATSAFSTLKPRKTVQTFIYEAAGQTYGVGMPIMLTFDQPIVHKRAVERSLELKTSKPVVGAWYWDSTGCAPPAQACLDFRPRDYWPTHTKVSFTGHLDGVQVAPGVYGDHTLRQTFYIGSSLIVVASTANHHMKLYKGGRLWRTWPISTGRPGDNTPDGTYVTIDKGNPVDMVGPGYNLEVPWSVRFTWTGDYLHDAYWSVGEQGFTNVSHGCVNMPPIDAEIYYKMEVPGDPVTITGSPRPGTWGNGWTEWFLSWKQYLAGSALHDAVEAGPTGSTFVNPATLTGGAAAPLGKAAGDNARALS
jgi:lipoprotein-anchoring transpeptidase ErfK/SrfK